MIRREDNRPIVRRTSVVIVSICLAAGCTGMDDFRDIEQRQGRLRWSQQFTQADALVFFTGSTRGNFEPCGCGGMHDGGLSRRATIIERFRKLNGRMILVDTGDVIRRGSVTQMAFLADAYRLMGYDAVLPGEAELRLPLETLKTLAKRHTLPLVVSNLKTRGENCFREVIELNRGGKRFAIIGVIAKRYVTGLPKENRDEFIFEEPLAAISRLTSRLRARCDAIILLSHFSRADREALFGNIDDVTVWVDTGGHRWEGKGSERPMITDSESHIVADSKPPLLVCWENDRRIGLACLKLRTEELPIAHAEMLPITREINQKDQLLEVYDAYKYAARQALIPKLFAARSQTRQTSDTGKNGGGFPYVAYDKCKTCHARQYDWWSKTAHARAFETLVRDDRDDDPNCWSCHSTGFRESGGFISPKHTPELKHVGCQSCHRIDPQTHPQHKPAKRGLYNLTRDWHCTRCHVPHRSPRYHYKTYLKRIACPTTQRAPATTSSQPIKQ